MFLFATRNMAGMKDGMNWIERCVKRLFDMVASFFGLVLFAPIYLIIIILLYVRRDGPVFFRQERIGFRGKPFYIVKFRTLPMRCPSKSESELTHDAQVIQSSLCRFLREHPLDELPQLWNVFVGDMSFVGPRPERKYFIDQIMAVNPDYVILYNMRPGLTSRATLYNGYTDTLQKMLVRLDMDLDYYVKRSLWLDVKIIFTTVAFIINGKKF